MGTLSIRVQGCHLLRALGFDTLHPRIRIVVDGTHKFHTKSKRNTFAPVFDEKFTVDNTHCSAIVEIFVYHCPVSGKTETEHLLGSCRISIERLAPDTKRSRRCFLAAKDGSGLAGTVNIIMKTNIRGGSGPVMNEHVERDCAHRLVCFLLRRDRSRLGDVDLLLALVKGPQQTSEAPPPVDGRDLHFRGAMLKESYATFEALMRDLCEEYKCTEDPRYKIAVLVEGCTDLEQPTSFTASHVVVVICGLCQDFVTPFQPFNSSPIWGGTHAVGYFDLLDPESFVLNVKVYSVSMTSRYCEIGQAQVRVSTLTSHYISTRQVFIFSDKDQMMPSVKGMVHLKMRPLNFGLVPLSAAKLVDQFYERLNRFFYRYDRKRISQVDALVNSRVEQLDSLMSELEVEYGREPGTIELCVTIKELHSLRLDATTDLDDKSVVVVVTMGDVVGRTRPKSVKNNFKTVFGDTFVFDVARETDMIRLEVVRDGHESTVYGRAELVCLKLQRGVRNGRTVFLVGAAGTADAYLSGMMDIVLQSDQLGQSYPVDTEALHLYAGRLRHCVYLHIPEKLHLVNIAVETVFDSEKFLREIVQKYGEVDATRVLYLTVLGCRQLPTRLGFSRDAYVVVRLGVKRCETRVVTGSAEPDFFEFFEFLLDQPQEKQLTIIVMVQQGLRVDKEVGRVVIPLDGLELEQQYHEWLPLQKASEKDDNFYDDVRGIVGVKFVMKDLELRNMFSNSLRLGQGAVFHHPQQELQRQRKTWRETLVAYQRRGRGHGPFLSFFGGWSNKLVRMKQQLQRHGRVSSDSSLSLSDISREQAQNQSFFSNSLNLMNEGMHSASEFCNLSNFDDPKLTFSPSSLSAEFEGCGSVLSSLVATSRSQEMRLHVLLLSCDDLEDRRSIAPSPYVMLSTLRKTCYSKVVFHTRCPTFNETFVFPVTEPENDYLSITVITDTPYGKKCLGHCLLSINNVPKGSPRTRRVSLVSSPHRAAAVQHGTLCLSLLGENFGLDYVPSISAENRFSGVLQKVLVNKFPKELHRLEWYIGEYYLRENELVEKVLSGYDAGTETVEAADLILTVNRITDLYLNDCLVESGACFVKVKIDRKVCCCTQAVQGVNGVFNMNQECTLTVSQPTTKLLRLTVHIEADGTFKCGECVFSLADLNQNIVQERTHFIVKNATLPSATAVGYITLSLLSYNFGSVVTSLDMCDESQYERLRDYYYFYLPEELHAVDVRYSKTLNMEAYIRRLTEKHGPEPGRHHFRISVLRARFFDVENNVPSFMIQVGIRRFKADVVYTSEDSEFLETFDVQVGLPAKERVWLIVMMADRTSAAATEVGVAEIPLRSTVRGKDARFDLPLQSRGREKRPFIREFIRVSVFSHDFGAYLGPE